MAIKMRYAKRNSSNSNYREESGITVFFRSINECGGNRLSWLGFKENKNEFYSLSGDAGKDAVDALINEIYLANIEEKSQGNMEEDLGRCIEAMKGNKVVLDGGLEFLKIDDDGERDSIVTGCCCGMEMAMNILSDLLRHESPWMGHDPWVKMKERDGFFDICDGEFPLVTFEKSEFHRYIKKAADEYMQFIEGPMTNRLRELCPEMADEFIEAFKYDFEI